MSLLYPLSYIADVQLKLPPKIVKKGRPKGADVTVVGKKSDHFDQRKGYDCVHFFYSLLFLSMGHQLA